MYFEIWKKGKLIKRGQGSEILNVLTWDNELMYTPTVSVDLPIYWLDYLDGREEFKIFVNDKCFWGIVWDIELNKSEEYMTLDVRHVISEWQYRQISVNNAVSSEQLNVVYKGDNTKKNKENDETITASDFSMSLSKAQNLTKATGISKAHASAWRTSNGDKVAVTVMNIAKQNGNTWEAVTQITQSGTYRVTFATAQGTAVAVTLTVNDKDEPSYNTLDDPAVVDKLEDIYNDHNFVYAGWQVDIQDGGDEMIDYVYSRQNKLEALTETMELTDDLWWRVGMVNERVVEIGRFGDERPLIFSLKPDGETNRQILQEPTVDYDFENVVNVATVYSDKSDGGMSSLTLREVYNDASLQKSGFPVVILREDVNNERYYTQYGSPSVQPIKLAPNNAIEFAVIDEESIALESGAIIEGTYSFNDLSPFQIEGKKVSNQKRIIAAKKVYSAVIKKLIQARRSYNVNVTVGELPASVNVGDKVRLLYDNSIWNLDACSSYWKKILEYSDWFYITRIETTIDVGEVETNVVTLTKWLKIDRETSNT